MIVKHEYQGEMLSLRAISKRAHVSYEALWKKVKSGLSAEEALERMKMLRGRRFEYQGQLLTLRELSDLCGISANALNYRIKSGRSVEEATSKPTRTQKIAAEARSNANAPGKCEPTEQERWVAAYAVCRTIAWDPAAFGLRCTEPMVEYVFESNAVGYTIRFLSPKLARLTAYYKEKGIPSDLYRVFQVDGENIKEVEQGGQIHIDMIKDDGEE